MKKLLFLCASCLSLSVYTHAQNWLLNGNNGTAATNFLGTKDSKALIFKTNNIERLRIMPGGNVGIGINAPLQKLDVNGNINMRKNFSLLMDNQKVLQADLATSTVFLGQGAGNYNTGPGNTATGYRALYSNTAGSYNTAMGTEALTYNTSNNNTAVGWNTLRLNTTGFENTAIGSDVLFSNTTGYRNVAAGYLALGSNTIGGTNVAVGSYALYNTIASYGNVAVGHGAGSTWHNGYNNVFIGEYAETSGSDIYNSIAIGRATMVSAPNQARIGNTYTTSIGGYAGWSTISDGRVKKNIRENVPGLAFINKLKAVTYNLDLDAADKIVQPNLALKKYATSAALSKTDMATRQAKQQIMYTGFIAQDVEKAAKELGYNFSGVDVAKNDKDLYGLRYAEFVVPLVKAVQELSKDNNVLKDENHAQKKLMESLEQRLQKLESLVNTQPAFTGNTQQPVSPSVISLQQNNPNPFNNTTTIIYNLPQQYHAAKIVITSLSGNVLKEINITGKGTQSLLIDGVSWLPGTYQYSLYVDGKHAGTRQMIIAR